MYQFGILNKTTTEFKIATAEEVSVLLRVKAMNEVEVFLTKENPRYNDCTNKALNILLDRLLEGKVVECGNVTVIKYNDICVERDEEVHEEILKFLLTT
jgi:hypothetical protein